MDTNNSEKKVVQRTFRMVESVYEQFKEKIAEEGYGVDEAINYLIKNYVSGRYDKQ